MISVDRDPTLSLVSSSRTKSNPRPISVAWFAIIGPHEPLEFYLVPPLKLDSDFHFCFRSTGLVLPIQLSAPL